MCTSPFLLFLLLLFLASLVPYGSESAPFTPSSCIPSPAVALPGVELGGAFTAKFYDPTTSLIPIGEGSHQRMEDTVGGGTKSLCALEVLTYRAANHVVVVAVVGRGLFVEHFLSGDEASLLSRSRCPASALH